MRKHVFSFIALLFVAQVAWAADVTLPADIPDYYSAADGKSGTNLYKAVNTITNVGFKSLGYDGAISAYQKSDVYPSDSVGKAGMLWDMYGGCGFTSGNECGNYNKECDCYNREHSVPKSWWGSGKNNMYSDIFHLVPTDGYVNNRRSSYAFGEVGTVKYTYNECKLGTSVSTVTTDKNTILGTSASCSGTVFEPRNEYKGDFARGYLGMIAKYSNESYSITSGEGSKIFEAFSSTTHFGLTQYGVVLLMKWHREDPVSQKEIDRNNGIQQTQGNRNPFIDYPYLAEYIWGEKAGETVDLSQLLPSTDPSFIPGVSNGWRDGGVGPLPTTPKYGVTWSVNGEDQQTDSVKENVKPTMPATPVSCSAESDVFMGWTTIAINGTQSEAPEVLYTKSAEFPAATDDVTYYAVFAKATKQESGSTPIDVNFNFSTMGLNDKQVISSPFVKEGVTITFSGGGTQPTYYTAGAAIRLYAGGTMTVAANAITQIDLTFGSSDKTNAITTNTGTFTSPTWKGNADEVIFTVGGTNGHRRIATVQVACGQGGVTTYSRYITSCQTTTEVELVQPELTTRKIIIGGQLFIMREGALYNIQGTRVK